MHSSPICFLNNKISFIMCYYRHYNGGIHVSDFYLGPSLNDLKNGIWKNDLKLPVFFDKFKN